MDAGVQSSGSPALEEGEEEMGQNTILTELTAELGAGGHKLKWDSK